MAGGEYNESSPNDFEKNPSPSLLSAPQALGAVAVLLNPVPSSVKPAPQERHEALILTRGAELERLRAKTSNCSHPLRTTIGCPLLYSPPLSNP